MQRSSQGLLQWRWKVQSQEIRSASGRGRMKSGALRSNIHLMPRQLTPGRVSG